MSTVAWDGKSLAADRNGARGDLVLVAPKLYPLIGGGALATTGDYAAGRLMVEWYQAGADLTKYPPCQATEGYASLIVAKPGGVCEYYSVNPHSIAVLDPFMAWGSGCDFALGAMARGATAKEAVEVACRFDVWSGGGVESVEVKADDEA